MINVYSYYHDVNYVKYPKELISRWESSWKQFGFNPVLLQECDSRKHHLFGEYNELIKGLPTINDPGWERHCWIRWLAYELSAPGMFTDWDVINYGLTPDEINEKEWHLTSMDKTGTAILYGSKLGIRAFVGIIPLATQLSYKVLGANREHVEDMHLMKSHLLNGLRFVHPVGFVYGESGYQSAKVVHFTNCKVPMEFRENNRYKLMDAHNQWRSENGQPPLQVLMSEHDTHL